MKNILLVSIPALLIIFSSGCKGTNQSTANSNNSNSSTVSTNPANSTATPSSAVPQQDMNQPNASQQSNAPNTGMATASLGSDISMMAMDFHSSLLQADKARLDPLLADDYKRTRNDGTVVNKAQELASLKKSDDMFSMEAQPAQINGDTATVSGKITLRSADKQGQTTGTWQTTDTFKKRSNKWVVVSSVEKKN